MRTVNSNGALANGLPEPEIRASTFVLFFSFL